MRLPGSSGDPTTPRPLRRLLAGCLGRHRRSLAALLLLQAAQTAAVLYLPVLNADVIDNGVVKDNTHYILVRGGVMVVVTAVQAICAIAAVLIGSRIAAVAGQDIRRAVFAKVQSLSAQEVSRFGIASLVTRTTNDVQQVQSLVLTALALVVSVPLTCLGAFLLALGQDVPLAFLLLLVVPFLAVPASLVLHRMRPLARLTQVRIDAVNRIFGEQITGIRVIRAFARGDYEERRFAEENVGLADAALRSGRLSTLLLPLGSTVVNAFSVPLMWFGAHLVVDGNMRIGALTAFLSYLTQILTAVTTATFVLMMLPRATACADRMDEVLRTTSSVAVPTAPVRRLSRSGHLEFRGASFSYPGAEAAVLQGINLAVGPGETMALTGSTGSGKSTLIGLATRVFEVTAGQVLVGGEDIRDLDPALLAETVGVVPQQAYLFSGTVASNLRYGRPDADDAELWHALEIAQAREFVEQWEGGLQAPVSQGGSNVSGGQRQRLAIARTLLRRPEIYLFDEAFSALDAGTEASLRAALARELAGATVLIVSQRLSTIRHTDGIAVLNQGRLVATGTHHALMESDATYREIALSQTSLEEAV